MVIPLIFGSMAKSILDAGSVQMEANIGYSSLVCSSFCTGIVACKWMIALVKKAQLKYFSWYCFAVGTLALILA